MVDNSKYTDVLNYVSLQPHEDGPLFYPTVSTINLGSHTVLDFYYHIQQNQAPTDGHQSEVQPVPECLGSDPSSVSDSCHSSFEDRYFLSILLEPRSLILVCDDMYKIHLHGIAERTTDVVTNKIANISATTATEGDVLERKTRVSLTIRYVPKILKTKFLFGK